MKVFEFRLELDRNSGEYGSGLMLVGANDAEEAEAIVNKLEKNKFDGTWVFVSEDKDLTYNCTTPTIILECSHVE